MATAPCLSKFTAATFGETDLQRERERERERERDRQTDRQTETETERQRQKWVGGGLGYFDDQ